MIPRTNSSAISLEKRYFAKLYISIWLLSIAYVFLHHIPEETYYHEFSANFTAFIQIWLSGYVNTDIFAVLPLFFEPQVHAPLAISNAADYIIGSNSTYPSMTMMYIIQNRILDLQPHTLMLLPVGVLIIPIAAFVMVRRFLSNYSWIAVYGFSIYILVYMNQLKPFRSAYVGTYTFILLFLFLYCIKGSLIDDLEMRVVGVSLLLLASLTTWWHTMGAVAAIYVGSIVTLSIITLSAIRVIPIRIRPHSNRLRSSLPHLTLHLLVFLSLFNIWKGGYIARFAGALVAGDLIGEQIIADLYRKLTGESQNQFLFNYNYADTFIGQFYYYSNYGIYVLAGLLLITGILLLLYGLVVGQPYRDKTTLNKFVIITSVGVAQVIFLIAYSYAGLGFRYVPFFFSLMGLYGILSYRSSNWTIILAIFSICIFIILAGNMVISSHMTGELGYDSQIEYEDTAASHNFINQYSDGRMPIITDFSLFGKYVYRETQTSKPDTNYQRLTVDKYAVFVGREAPSQELQDGYFVVDYETMNKGSPIHSYGARSLLQAKPNEIRTNQNLSTVYTDGSLSVTKLTG